MAIIIGICAVCGQEIAERSPGVWTHYWADPVPPHKAVPRKHPTFPEHG